HLPPESPLHCLTNVQNLLNQPYNCQDAGDGPSGTPWCAPAILEAVSSSRDEGQRLLNENTPTSSANGRGRWCSNCVRRTDKSMAGSGGSRTSWDQRGHAAELDSADRGRQGTTCGDHDSGARAYS